MKWEPVVLMVLVIGLGAWLVYAGRDVMPREDVRAGAILFDATIVGTRGRIEHVPAGAPDAAPDDLDTFRWLPEGAPAGATLSRERAVEAFGSEVIATMDAGGQPPVFRLLNITRWSSLAWVALGFVAQAVFASRFVIQWVISERRRESVVPEVFWWISLAGGLCLFAYFVWRRDIVGVFGQSSGIVIYARNLRLIGKQKRRAARAQDAERSDVPPPPPPPPSGG